jgi:hypothetical protein
VLVRNLAQLGRSRSVSGRSTASSKIQKSIARRSVFSAKEEIFEDRVAIWVAPPRIFKWARSDLKQVGPRRRRLPGPQL